MNVTEKRGKRSLTKDGAIAGCQREKKGCLPRCLGSFSFQADGAVPADQVRFLCGVLRANPAGGGGVGSKDTSGVSG